MKIVTTAIMPNGSRVECVTTFPDDVTAEVLATGNALERTRGKLQAATEVAAENAFVAQKDFNASRERRTQERAMRGRKPPPRGPDQVAFAGSKEQAVPVPGTGTHSHEDALRLAGFEEVKEKGGRLTVRALPQRKGE